MTHLLLIGLAVLGVLVVGYRGWRRSKKKSETVILESIETGIPNDAPVEPTEKPASTHKKKRVNVTEVKKLFSAADMILVKGDLAEAAKAFLKVLALDVNHEASTNKLGLIYLKQDLPNKAELMFLKLTELYPNQALYFSNLAMACYAQEKLDAAITHYVKAISLDKKRSARYLSLAEVYKKKHDRDRVLGCYLEASRLEPRNSELLFALVDLYEEEGEAEKVSDYLKKILQYEPYNKEAKARMAKLAK